MDIPLHADAVELDMIECCALERGCAQEAHLPFVQEYLAGIGERHPVYKALIMLGIFKNTLHLEFVPHEIYRVVYSYIAAAEKVALEADKDADAMLNCGHTAEQHCEALGNVWTKIKPSQAIG